MSVTKCVWQYHDRSKDLLPLFDYFRLVANEAIRVGIEKNLTSKFKLHYELYYKLRSEFHCRYIYGALECAAAKLKSYRKIKRKNHNAKTPYIFKNHLILDSDSYRISNEEIRIPIKPKNYCIVKLNRYVLDQIQGTKIGSITITENKLIISYSKEPQIQKPNRFVAIDRNLDNVTTFDTQNKSAVYDLQKTNQIKQLTFK